MDWKEYERRKRELILTCEDPLEYEEKVKELLKELEQEKDEA